MSDEPTLQLPTPEHARLEDGVGRWNVECTYYMAEGQPPLKTTGRDSIERIGPYWTMSNFRSDLMGAPFAGRAAIGYDPIRKKWMATWVDSMSPFLFVLEGEFDEAGKVLSMRCEAPTPTGEMAKFRTREEHVSRDQRVLQMFHVREDGTESQMLEFVYRRAR